MQSYLNILETLLKYGRIKTDRTGTGTNSVFGYQLRHDMSNGFPLLTTKRVPLRWVAVELMWFLNGRTDNQFLKDHGVDIWDEWVRKDGTLGPVYGKQWRDFGGVDQIQQLVTSLKINPDSRRMIVSAWNPPQVPDMALPPCHTMFQCEVHSGILSLHLYARSIDSFLGLPFNIASYALLLKILANVCDLQEGELIISFGDLHLYSNHFEQARKQITRTPYRLPTVTLKRKLENPWDFVWEDVEVTNYQYHPPIPAPVAV